MMNAIIVPFKCPVNNTYGFKCENIDPVQAVIIKSVVTNNITDSEDYKLTRSCVPFLQGFTYDRPGEFVYVEFWSNNFQAIEIFCEHIRCQIINPERYSLMKELYNL